MVKRLSILMLLIATALSGRALPYDLARSRALFLSDKMAYELNLSDRQYDAVYQVNLDYFLTVNPDNLYGTYWKQRNRELERIFSKNQYHQYVRIKYFYRPISYSDGKYRYGVYGRYRDARHFYRKHPSVYSNYRGGRYFRHEGPAPRRDLQRGTPPPRRDLRKEGPAPRRDFRGEGPAPRRDLRRDGPPPRREIRRDGPPPRRDFRKEERRREHIRKHEQRREQERRARRHNDEKRRSEWY